MIVVFLIPLLVRMFRAVHRRYQVARLTGTKNLRQVGLSTVDRELAKARRLFNIAVDEGWLLRSPFTKAVSKNLIHDAAETPNPIKTRELTDEETLRVINELGHSSKTSHSTSIHRGNGYWS